jgi:hypothetical protein
MQWGVFFAISAAHLYQNYLETRERKNFNDIDKKKQLI